MFGKKRNWSSPLHTKARSNMLLRVLAPLSQVVALLHLSRSCNQSALSHRGFGDVGGCRWQGTPDSFPAFAFRSYHGASDSRREPHELGTPGKVKSNFYDPKSCIGKTIQQGTHCVECCLRLPSCISQPLLAHYHTSQTLRPAPS